MNDPKTTAATIRKLKRRIESLKARNKQLQQEYFRRVAETHRLILKLEKTLREYEAKDH